MLFLAVLFTASLNYAHAADIEEVKNKVQMMCANCHGYDGIANLPGAANLSGQQEIYLIQQLKAYRSGERQNAMMNVIGKSLSDDDINNLSAWYAGIKIIVEAPPQ
jgi:cytochrome c553